MTVDAFDARGRWKDTARAVTADHGFLLGDQDFWAKYRMDPP